MKSFLSALVVVFNFSIALAYKPISDERRTELLRQFVYTPDVVILKTPLKKACSSQDFEYTTTYPGRDTAYTVKAKVYFAKQTHAPVVFMLPPIGGSNQLDTAMASTLCQHNIAAVLLLNDFAGIGSSVLMPVEDHDHTPRRVASAIKGGILALALFSDINTDKVGLFGASLGGILGSTAYGVLPEISAASFIVNGGDVPNTLTYSDQGPIIRVKKARMVEVGLKTDAQYEEYLNEHITLDPIHFAPLIDPDSIKLYLSKSDNSVPTRNQMAYFNALGAPKQTSFYGWNHQLTIFAVLGAGSEKDNIATWFLKRFALPNPRSIQD